MNERERVNPAEVTLLAAIVAAAAWLRFYGLAWGAPYFHFHIDEHFVFAGADMLRRSLREASLSVKFFMYGPLTMWLLNIVRWGYEAVAGPLVLTKNADEITYMVMGRAISASFGTASVVVVWAIGRRVGGRAAGLMSALLLATAVVHYRESHFFSVDVTMLFFCLLAWWASLRIAAEGRLRDYVAAGLSLGAALACKYTALFIVPVIGIAHLCTLTSLRQPPAGGWTRWVLRGITPLAVAVVVFFAVDPMAILYFGKFRDDVVYWVMGPNSGSWRPIFIAQFADIHHPRLYWFTNVMYWGLGPALEGVGVLGTIWLAARRDRAALVAAAFPVAYYLTAGEGVAPFMRYAAPLAAGCAVTAAVLCADSMRRPRLRVAGALVALVVCGSTAIYAAAYTEVYRAPDSRLQASAWLAAHVPEGTHILVEPSHNTPPMGSYYTKDIDFNGDYVMWGTEPANRDKRDYFNLHTLDTYRYLYDPKPTADDKRGYIDSRLALADWIVIDDTFLDFYSHLPESDHAVVKQYYRDLFAGRLGFALIKTFKTYPMLFGKHLVDDRAELTFRLFDHPRVFLFGRITRHSPAPESPNSN